MDRQQVLPRVYTISEVLSTDECKKLVKLSEGIGYEPAELDIDGQKIKNDIRNHDYVVYTDDDLSTK